jgi:hypothetical protein
MYFHIACGKTKILSGSKRTFDFHLNFATCYYMPLYQSVLHFGGDTTYTWFSGPSVGLATSKRLAGLGVWADSQHSTHIYLPKLSRANPASYTIGTGGCFTGDKATGA